MKKIIGIVGSKENKVTSYILGEVLSNSGRSVKTMSCEEALCLRKQCEEEILIVEIDLEDLERVCDNKISLDIVIDIDMTLDRYKKKCDLLGKIKLINSLTDETLVVLNTDDSDSSSLIPLNSKSTIISYGLNGKSTVTASSLDFGDKTQFNLCLQRKIQSIEGTVIDQFEHPMELNLIGIENLYGALAAIATTFYFNIDIETVKKTLLNLTGVKRNFKKIHEGKVTIIDSCAKSLSDYESILYNLQNMDYRRLIVMNMIEGNEEQTDKEVAEIIMGWSNAINLKSLVTVIDMREIYNRDHYKELSRNDIDYNVCSEVQKGLEDCLLRAEDGDMFLILGGLETDLIEESIKLN